MLAPFVRVAHALLTRRRAERELEEELSFHLEMEIEANRAHGMSAAEARRAALRDLGGVQQTREAVREQRSSWVDQLAVDVRHAARGLAKARAFTVAIVATLAIGIGGGTVVFSVVEALLLRPLPYERPDRLGVFSPWSKRWFDHEAIGRDSRSFTGMAAYVERAANLIVSGQSERGRIAAISANFFDVLGVKPPSGRTFSDGETHSGQDRVVILSERFARARFGSARAALGQDLIIDRDVLTIIGVLPAEFRTPSELVPGRESVFARAVQAFVPISPTNNPDTWWDPARWEDSCVVGRLRDSVTISQARADIEHLATLPDRGRAEIARSLKPLREAVSGEFAARLVALCIAVGILLVAACGNVCNLLLERLERRRAELALRAALGASLPQLARNVLSETALVIVAGGAAGALVAWGGVRVIQVYGGAVLANLTTVRVSLPVLGFAAGLSILTAVPIGLALIARLVRGGVGRSLHAPVIERPVAGRLSLSALLVVTQMVLSAILVVVGALLARDLANLVSVDLGFKPTGVFTAEIGLDHVQYHGISSQFFVDLRDRLAETPGVDRVAVAATAPGRGQRGGFGIQVGRRPLGLVEGTAVSEGYFSMLSIPLLAGRDFATSDSRRRGSAVVVINEAFATEHWRSIQAAIGQPLAFLPGLDNTAWPAEVVGVVGNSNETGTALTWQPRIYTYFPQSCCYERMTVLVKSRANARTVAGTLSAVVKRLDPQLPVGTVASLERIVSSHYARQRLTLVMMATFALLTLVLAAVGIHGVIAYAVALRRREIGIRLALGATGSSVVWLFVVRAVRLVVLGLLIGVPAGLMFRWIAVIEWVGSAQSDWVTSLGGVGVVAITGVMAALVPAWRASRLDAMDVLRSE